MSKKSERRHSSVWLPSPPAQPVTLQTQLQRHCPSVETRFNTYGG